MIRQGEAVSTNDVHTLLIMIGSNRDYAFYKREVAIALSTLVEERDGQLKLIETQSKRIAELTKALEKSRSNNESLVLLAREQISQNVKLLRENETMRGLISLQAVRGNKGQGPLWNGMEQFNRNTVSEARVRSADDGKQTETQKEAIDRSWGIFRAEEPVAPAPRRSPAQPTGDPLGR